MFKVNLNAIGVIQKKQFLGLYGLFQAYSIFTMLFCASSLAQLRNNLCKPSKSTPHNLVHIQPAIILLTQLCRFQLVSLLIASVFIKPYLSRVALVYLVYYSLIIATIFKQLYWSFDYWFWSCLCVCCNIESCFCLASSEQFRHSSSHCRLTRYAWWYLY